MVIVKTARDIQDWFYSVNSELEKGQSKEVSIYTMVQGIIQTAISSSTSALFLIQRKEFSIITFIFDAV